MKRNDGQCELSALKDGKNVFVGAHGNSIRALVKHIKGLSDDEIMDVEIPNFPPLVFEFDEKIERRF